jgi:hypothetical protein
MHRSLWPSRAANGCGLALVVVAAEIMSAGHAAQGAPGHASVAESGAGAPAATGAAPPPSTSQQRDEIVAPTAKPTPKQARDGEREETLGKALARKGDCRAALEHFEKSYSLTGREGALSGAAGCHESGGDLVKAHALVAQLVRLHAAADAKQRKAREQWLERLASKTSELEIAVSTKGARIEVDGSLWSDGNGDGRSKGRVSAGEHQIRVLLDGFEPVATKASIDAGATRTVDVTLVPVRARPIDVSEFTRAPVTDFCRIRPETDTRRYQKQRLVMFDLAGADVTNAPEREVDAKGNVVGQRRAFEQANLHDHLRAVFFKTFPAPRFFNVKATAESPATLRHKPFVSSSDMMAAADVDPFAAYSIACADWVALPRVLSKDAEWKQVQKQRNDANGKPQKYLGWTLSITWSAEMDVYRREQDGWRLHATVHGSNGGLLGLAFGLAAGAQQGDGKKELPNLSDRPDSKCSVPFAGTLSAVGEGFAACASSATKLGEEIAGARVVLEAPAAPSGGAAKGADLMAADAGADASVGELNDSGAAPDTAPTTAMDAGTVSAQAEAGPANSVGTSPAAANEARPGAAADVAVAIAPEIRAAVAGYRGAVSTKNLASLRAAVGVHGLEGTAQAAEKAYQSCNGAVSSLAKAEKELRGLASADLSSLGTKAALGFAACLGIGASIDLGAATAPGTGQIRSDVCKDVKDDVALGDAALVAVSTCDGRTAIEQATLALQKEAFHLDGWKLFATLQAATSTRRGVFGLALGKAEGANRGHMYLAMERQPDGSTRRVGWGRVVRQGPGGEKGDSEPSDVKFRAGAAPVGTRMDEHAQIGVLLGLRPQFGLFTSKGRIPAAAVAGVALEGGYNASQFVPIADEVWSRIYVSIEGGSGTRIISTDLVPEATFYVANRVAVFTGGGFGYASASVGSSSAGNMGLLATGGVDCSLTPDWNARASLWYRQGLSSSSEAGTLSAVRLGAAVGYTF